MNWREAMERESRTNRQHADALALLKAREGSRDVKWKAIQRAEEKMLKLQVFDPENIAKV